MTNVIQDPGFAQGINTWVCSRGSTIATPSWERTITHAGTGAARLTRTATVDTGVISFNQGATRYPAAPSSQWSGSAWVYPDVTTGARDMNVAVIYFDAAGAVLGSVQGPTVACAQKTWTQIFLPPSQLPDTVASVMMQVNGRGGTWPPGSTWIMDDVSFSPRVELIIQNQYSIGYGWRNWNVFTDPPAPNAAFTVWPIGKTSVGTSGTLDANGNGYVRLLSKYRGNTYTALAEVVGAGSGTAQFIVPAVVWTNFTVGGVSLRIGVQWAPDQGAPGGQGAASIDWGDGSPVELLQQVDPIEEGTLIGLHYYPLVATTQTYTVTLTTGGTILTRQAVIAAGSRALLTTGDGLRRARASIQEWPDFDYRRDVSTLDIQGRQEPVMLVSTVRMPTTEATFLTLTTAESDAFERVLNYEGKVMLESVCPGVENGWFVITQYTRTRLTNRGDEVRRLWPVSMQQVAAP